MDNGSSRGILDQIEQQDMIRLGKSRDKIAIWGEVGSSGVLGGLHSFDLIGLQIEAGDDARWSAGYERIAKKQRIPIWRPTGKDLVSRALGQFSGSAAIYGDGVDVGRLAWYLRSECNLLAIRRPLGPNHSHRRRTELEPLTAIDSAAQKIALGIAHISSPLSILGKTNVDGGDP